MSFATGINNLHQTINQGSINETKPVAGTKSSVPANQSSNLEHADQANLSSASGIVAQSMESSDVRSAKVAALQQAIADGSYSVSSSDVAEKIIQSLLK
ncbi:MAG TPA: flagellar biosynthesis anti-sigma factor FlgM [Edaphobacter sp.]|jgi:negative regulator of flagellin synthesis FlgM|nr:flagellar biosynthesis anti-sigma factor FlgM [Edaphobacter sp.]